MGLLNKYPNIYALGVLKNMSDMEYEWKHIGINICSLLRISGFDEILMESAWNINGIVIRSMGNVGAHGN